MKHAFRTLLCGAALLTASASYAQTKQTRPVEAFQAVQAGGGIDVFLTQGPTAAVVVEAASEVQPHLLTTIRNGTLVVGWEQNYSWKKLLPGKSPGKVSVYVTCPTLTALSVSGGSDARGETAFTADNLRLSASGGGDIRLALTAKALTSQASGGSDITVSGRVERQKVAVSGGSDYHAFALQSTTAEVSASGGSDAEVMVEGELKSSASGGSGVRYKGGARVVSSHASGGSSTKPAR
ncbi:head GIN domain-containing protein [Hymenobacter aquaticus]|nr:head GIN domain-containing protein [Hymenobacter aquaticus]